MPVISAENVSHAYGNEEVLRNVSVALEESGRIGLVGPNGEGKTTLLRILLGELDSTLGEVSRRRGLRIGYLPQTPPALSGSTIHEAMLDVFDALRRMERTLHALADRMNDGDEQALARYGAMQTEFEGLGGYDYPIRVEQVLTGLAFPREMWGRPLDTLSGGQLTRVHLAKLLLAAPEVLMLDEPTNHLDVDSIEWLEHWLQSYSGALIVVSHDRYFLDRVTNGTWELAFGVAETYPGNYTRHLKLRAERRAARLKEWEAQQAYIARTEEFIARNIAGQRTKEAQGRRKRLERFLRDEAIEPPQDHKTIHLRLDVPVRTGDIVLRAQDLAVGYDPGEPILSGLQLEALRGDRVAVVGANGVGKSTLLRTLLGELDPLAGSVRPGANVAVGYLSQTHAELDPDRTALDAVMGAPGGCPISRARDVLGSLLVSGDDVYKRVRDLSGGQRSRVVLARLMVQQANVLMLDEPTNHLDIPSTEIMQEALAGFEGTVFFVSHDRYLIEAVATHLWVVEEGAVRCLLGGWERYLAWRVERRERTRLGRKQDTQDATSDRTEETRKQDYRDARRRANERQRLRRRHDEIEDEIEAVEQELGRINAQIAAASEAQNMQQIEQLSGRYAQQDACLKGLWNEWERIGEQLERKQTDG